MPIDSPVPVDCDPAPTSSGLVPSDAVEQPAAYGGRPWPGVPLAALVACVTGLAVATYGLSLPRSLFGVHDYDDGVYFGAALRLVAGFAPYRDFVLLHPPGILLLLAPFALASRAVGSGDGLAMARCATVLVAGADCALLALVVRHRGAVASLGAGMALACFPLAVTGDQTVLLEPYLGGFCLLGALLAFSGGELVSGRRAVWAGVAFGFAGAVKIWAIFPVIALLCCCAGRWRASGRPLAAGIAAGFLVPCLPFVLLAPGAFVHDVIVVQLARSAGSAGYGLLARLGELTGIAGMAALHLDPDGIVAFVLAFAVLYVVACCYATMWAKARRCDWFVLGAAASNVAAVLVAREFYAYYAYFPAMFVAATLGVCAGRLLEICGRVGGATRGLTSSLRDPRALRDRRVSLGAVAAGAILVAAAVMMPFDVAETHAYIEGSKPTDPAALVDRVIPPGACVLADEVVVLIVSGRFDATSPGCPSIVDTYGSWLSAAPALPPPAPGWEVPSFARQWRAWLARAGWFVETAPESDYIPWAPSLLAWFDGHFRLVAVGTRLYIYKKRAQPQGAASSPSPP